MPKRIGLRAGLFVLILLVWTATTWAVPLSIDSNIQAILARQAEAAGGFDFVVLGDSRDGAETFARLLNQVKALKPLFVIHTGDFVKNGDPVEYEDYIKQIALFDIPIVHVPGNHDIRNGGGENYRRYVGEPNWAFDLGRYRFVGLDNAAGKFSPEAVAFARKALIPEKTCLVAFHYPPAVGRWAVHSMVDDQQGGRGGEVLGLLEKKRSSWSFSVISICMMKWLFGAPNISLPPEAGPSCTGNMVSGKRNTDSYWFR